MRRGLGVLLDRAQEYAVPGFATIEVAAKRKGVSYGAMRQWLASHPNVALRKVGTNVLVREPDLEQYVPVK